MTAPQSAGPLLIIARAPGPEKGGRMRVVRELTAEEDAAFRDASRHLHSFRRSRDLFPLVRLNARMVMKGAQEILARPREVLRVTQEREHLGREFNRLIVNYLTSFRLYLDQMATRLVDVYRPQGTEFAAFQAARRRAHDTMPEYRIVYNARDFVLHCGMLVSGVQFSEGLSQKPGHEVTHTTALECSRDFLLEEFGKQWKHAHGDLQKLPPTFPIHLMFVPATRALHDIDSKVMEAERPSLLASAQRIVGILHSAETEPGEGVAVAQIERHAPMTNFTFIHAYPGIIGWLGLPYERILQF